MLTESQKSSARWHGADGPKKRRSMLRRLRTQLLELRGDASVPMADYDTLREAGRVLDRMLATVGNDIAEATNIKRDWDRAIEAATCAIEAIPLDSVADVIALAELARELGAPDWAIDAVNDYGWPRERRRLTRESVATLARRCANEAADAAGFVAKVRAAMPAAAEKHADLITRITTLAVAEKFEAAANPTHAGGR